MVAKKKVSDGIRSKHKRVRYPNFEKLRFPTYITASFFYAASGEGLTRGIYMFYAASAENLRKALVDRFGDYAVDSEASKGLILLAGFEDLVPAGVLSLLQLKDRGRRMPAGFSFYAKLHVNYT